MPHPNQMCETWISRVLTDELGHRIGRIDDIYTDDDTGQPEWLAVTIGLMGSSTRLVPVRRATVGGGGVQVPFPKDQVKVAPSVGADGKLSRKEKSRLYAHYGCSHAVERNLLQRSLGVDLPAISPRVDGPDGPNGRDVSRSVDLRERSGSTDVRDPRPPDDPCARAEEPSPGGHEGRGRWPDDDAIFGLSQETAHRRTR